MQKRILITSDYRLTNNPQSIRVDLRTKLNMNNSLHNCTRRHN